MNSVNGVITGGEFRPQFVSGAPVNGTDEVQTLTFGGTPSGGTFTLYMAGINEIPGGETAPITWSGTGATLATNIQTALRALLGTSNVTVTGTGPFTVTFAAALGKLDVPLLRLLNNSMTGSSPTITVTVATPGVTATLRGAPPGTQVVDQSTGIAYINTGTAQAPTWTKVGTQT